MTTGGWEVRLLALDPGINCSGWALFEDGQLVRAGVCFGRPEDAARPSIERVVMMGDRLCEEVVPHYPPPDRLVLERPQIYRPDRAKGNPNDLLVLAELGAYVTGRLTHRRAVKQYLPREWKGNVDPEVCVARVQERLTLGERALVEFPPSACDGCRAFGPCVKPSCPMHNAFDAIGLGLFDLGRFGKRRVIVR